MILLYLVFLGVIWVLVLLGSVLLITLPLPKRWWRALIRLVLIVALLPLPIVDELLGRSQFQRLCEENSKISVDPERARGRTVHLAPDQDTVAQGTPIRIVIKPWRYVDATTGETILSFNTVQAEGGWFVHTFPVAEGRKPLTFEKSYCAPGGSRQSAVALFKELDIKDINRPEKTAAKR